MRQCGRAHPRRQRQARPRHKLLCATERFRLRAALYRCPSVRSQRTGKHYVHNVGIIGGAVVQRANHIISADQQRRPNPGRTVVSERNVSGAPSHVRCVKLRVRVIRKRVAAFLPL